MLRLSTAFTPISSRPISFIGLNGDEIVNILDVVVLVNFVLAGENYDENSDINNDGVVNILDVVQLVNIVLNS